MGDKKSKKKWICDYCKKEQKAGKTKYKDHDGYICWDCECIRMDGAMDVVHIPSMP